MIYFLLPSHPTVLALQIAGRYSGLRFERVAETKGR